MADDSERVRAVYSECMLCVSSMSRGSQHSFALLAVPAFFGMISDTASDVIATLEGRIASRGLRIKSVSSLPNSSAATVDVRAGSLTLGTTIPREKFSTRFPYYDCVCRRATT